MVVTFGVVSTGMTGIKWAADAVDCIGSVEVQFLYRRCSNPPAFSFSVLLTFLAQLQCPCLSSPA